MNLRQCCSIEIVSHTQTSKKMKKIMSLAFETIVCLFVYVCACVRVF